MSDNGRNEETEDQERRSVGRRGLLKGAAAAGVGIAAWSVPSITSLGGTPVYAAVCTRPVDTFEAGSRNTDCTVNCLSGSIRYKNWSTKQCPGPAWSGAAYLSDSGGTPAPGSGLCTPQAHATVSGVPAGLKCVVHVQVTQGNCTNDIISQGSSPVFDHSTTVPLPLVTCGSGTSSNLFTRVQIICSEQEGCLPT